MGLWVCREVFRYLHLRKRIPEEQLACYDSSWSDEEVAQWDGNFKSDGGLMLVCCEREVEVSEFRRILEEFIRFKAFG